MVRAWNRAVESECGAIDPEQWDRAVFVPRALRKRPSSFFHPKDKILPPLRSSSYSPSAFQFSILIDIELNSVSIHLLVQNNSSLLNPSFFLPDFEKREI